MRCDAVLSAELSAVVTSLPRSSAVDAVVALAEDAPVCNVVLMDDYPSASQSSLHRSGQFSDKLLAFIIMAGTIARGNNWYVERLAVVIFIKPKVKPEAATEPRASWKRLLFTWRVTAIRNASRAAHGVELSTQQ